MQGYDYGGKRRSVPMPRELYERQGDVSDVVFACGHTIQDDGDTIHLYYGGADRCIALATGRVSEILAWLGGHPSAESDL